MTAAVHPVPPSLDAIVAACSDRLVESGRSSFEAAESERLSPLFYHVLRRRGWPEAVSESERRDFRRAYYRSAGHNVELLSALSDVAVALARNGIACVALKGADLVKRLYPNIALRPMGDADVYVPAESAERAEAVLGSLGYRPWCPDMTPGLSRRARHARLYVGGRHEATSLDLHWSLVGHREDVRAPSRDWLFRNIRDGVEPWRHLTDTAHLLYLAAHMKLQHYDEEIPLLWLIDFYLLASRGSVDWDELSADAKRLGWGAAVAAVALDVRKRLGVPLPPPLETLDASSGPRLPLHRRGARNEPERVWNELSTLPWSQRLALVRAFLLPSPEYVRFRYRPLIWPLGYVARWWTTVAKAGALLVRSLRREPGTRPLLARRKSC